MAADHIKKVLFKTDYPPCFVPALLAGNAFCFKMLQNSFKKTRMFFWSVGEPQYQEANNVIFSANSPAILKTKARKIDCFLLLKNLQMHIPRKKGNGDMERRG